MSNQDTDDVLNFINSLPDSSSNTPKVKSKISGSNDDFLEFLDELTAHEKNTKSAGSSRGKFEPKKRLDSNVDPQISATAPSESTFENQHQQGRNNVAVSKVPKVYGEDKVNPDTNLRHLRSVGQSQITDEATIDPLSSISSWWSSEGSSKVSSLWGSITSNAHQLSETTLQIASNTSQSLSHQRRKLLTESGGVSDSEQILHITSKLNSILTTMSQQIKDGLIDKEDELMNILLVHDLYNVARLDCLCAAKFEKVMSQVEGGIKTTVNNFNHKQEHDSETKYCDLSLFTGKQIDGEKLCFANLESSIKHFSKITDSEQPSIRNGEPLGHEINKSNVFIAIQSITSGNADTNYGGSTYIEANNADSFSFTMILKDITNSITIVSKSQPFPLKWSRWVSGNCQDVQAEFGTNESEVAVDPSEWVRDWIHDGLGLAFAVLAQEYITRRMGI